MGVDFALKTYCTLIMFLLSAQNNFCIMLGSWVERHVKKNQAGILCLWLVGFQASIIWMFFWKIYSRTNFLKPPVSGFCDGLPFVLPPPLSCQASPLINELSKPPFSRQSPLYIGFSWPPPSLKVRSFSEPQKY